MKIDWNPKSSTQFMARRCVVMQEEGMTGEQIASFFRRHRTYIFALIRWAKDHPIDENQETSYDLAHTDYMNDKERESE